MDIGTIKIWIGENSNIVGDVALIVVFFVCGVWHIASLERGESMEFNVHDWMKKGGRAVVAMPEGCVPPYFVAAPTKVQLRAAMKKAGWPQSSPYGDYVAPDGNPVRVIGDSKVLDDVAENRRIVARNMAEAAAPLGSLLVIWGDNAFHRDRENMIDRAIQSGRWIVRDMP